jgi:hypothetical protein
MTQLAELRQVNWVTIRLARPSLIFSLHYFHMAIRFSVLDRLGTPRAKQDPKFAVTAALGTSRSSGAR